MRYQNKGPFGIQDNYKNNILEAANQKFPNEQSKAKAKTLYEYTYDGITGKFHNKLGDNVNTAAEAIELNQTLDKAFAPKPKPQQLELPFKKDEPADVNTINKELNKYRRPDDQIKTFDNLDPTTYPSDPKQREKLFEPMLDRLQNKDPQKEAAKKKLKAMDQLNLSDEISKISKEITQMEQMIKLRKEMNNIPKPTINRAKENGLSLEFTKEKLANGKILKDL